MGDPEFGGDSSGVDHLLHDVVKIECSKFAFAALRKDGTVVAWNDAENGGDTSPLDHLLDVAVMSVTFDVGYSSFIAKLQDGSKVMWPSLHGDAPFYIVPS